MLYPSFHTVLATDHWPWPYSALLSDAKSLLRCSVAMLPGPDRDLNPELTTGKARSTAAWLYRRHGLRAIGLCLKNARIAKDDVDLKEWWEYTADKVKELSNGRA